MIFTAYCRSVSWVGEKHDMYIALCQTNHTVATLSENLTERKVIVDIPNTTQCGTTVDALHQILANKYALDPHVL